jgi:hypothetical protein
MSSSEAEYIEVVTYEALDRLVTFAHFMNKHPKDLGQTLWLEGLKKHVKSCEEQTKTVHQGNHIVCALDHDKQMWETRQLDCIDLFALPFDILCCRDTTKSDDLEPVYPVAKMVQRDGGLQREICAESEPDDIVVIVSYSTDGQEYVEREARYIVEQFMFAFSINRDEVLEIDPDEGMPLSCDLYKKRVENARIIWMHNTPKGRVVKYLEHLPNTHNLILHYIGPVDKDALVPPRREHGGRIRSLDLKYALDLPSGSRIIKLFYVSPHNHDSDKHEVFLVHASGGFVHNLLGQAPQLADIVWFRWSVTEESVMIMAERFYNELVESPYRTSQALLKAKNTAYNEWKSDSERYYAWAAPVLITQREHDAAAMGVSPSANGPMQEPTLITQRDHDAEHAAADNSIDPDATLRDALRSLELT